METQTATKKTPIAADLTGVKIPHRSLVGCDGNAFAVMGHTIKHLRKAGNGQDIIDRYTTAAKSGDYSHLLCVSMDFLGG